MALNFANNNSLSAITVLPASVSGGALTLLETQTASSSATIDFTSNIDSTYKEYILSFMIFMLLHNILILNFKLMLVVEVVLMKLLQVLFLKQNIMKMIVKHF